MTKHKKIQKECSDIKKNIRLNTDFLNVILEQHNALASKTKEVKSSIKKLKILLRKQCK